MSRKYGRVWKAFGFLGVGTYAPSFLDVTDEPPVQVEDVYVTDPQALQHILLKEPAVYEETPIFISSVHEDIPFPGYTAYCASKGGVRMMMRNLAMEMAPYKINVNNIAPGAIARR